MGEQFYSAEEAAAVLGLQVRTVRNHVREGRLPGARIGKQYRIARADLEAWTGGGPARAEGAAAAVPAPPADSLQVSSVIQLDQIRAATADRIINTLTAMALTSPTDSGAPRVEPLYDEQRQRLKIIVVGDAQATIEILRAVEALSHD